MTPARSRHPAAPGPSRIAQACYVALRLAGWLASSAAFVAALWVLAFVLLGDFSFERFVLHLDNFAARYAAADDARRAMFEAQFWSASGVLLLVVAVLRRHGLSDLVSPAKEATDGQD